MFLLIRMVFKKRKDGTHISIHLMFLLISSIPIDTFQFILHFNTSHVSINRPSFLLTAQHCSHFNTSHVSINRMLAALEEHMDAHFNTSHVSINRRVFCNRLLTGLISIHLMFLLISLSGLRWTCTGTISIHLMFLLIRSRSPSKKNSIGFQYISCFY